MTNPLADAVVDWSEYRRVKRRLIVLLIGWVPVLLVVGGLLPIILHIYVPSYLIAVAYMLLTGFAWLQYVFSSCPNCGVTLRGRQLYRRTCPQCGVVING